MSLPTQEVSTVFEWAQERFGVEFPIFAFSHCRDVVAAVTNAGGLGVLGATAHTPERLETDLRWIDEQVAGKPYGVDLLLPVTHADTDGVPQEARTFPDEHLRFLEGMLDRYGVPGLPAEVQPSRGRLGVNGDSVSSLLDVTFEHPVSLVASALGPPTKDLVDRAHDREIAVAALVGTAEHARRQVAAGVDVIVAQGGEAGGHTGQVSTLVLVPEVVRVAQGLPVLAAGGIVTGCQMAAAMALGAQGVWCGSVWLTTEEAETDPSVKAKMLEAGSSGTVRSRSLTGKPARMLSTAWTSEWDGPASPGALPMPLQTMLTASAVQRINRAAGQGNEGARELATYFVGQGVGLMDRVKPARQVVQEMIEEYLLVGERFAAQLGR